MVEAAPSDLDGEDTAQKIQVKRAKGAAKERATSSGLASCTAFCAFVVGLVGLAVKAAFSTDVCVLVSQTRPPSDVLARLFSHASLHVVDALSCVRVRSQLEGLDDAVADEARSCLGDWEMHHGTHGSCSAIPGMVPSVIEACFADDIDWTQHYALFCGPTRGSCMPI